MRIEWAIPCRYCEVVNNEVSMIGGNADLFRVPDLPAPIGVWVALHVVTPDYDTGPDHPHRYESHVLDPAMDPIPGTEMTVEGVIAPPSAIPGKESEEVVASFHQFMAEEEGTYTIEMRVDDRTQTVAITVKLPADESDEATALDEGA